MSFFTSLKFYRPGDPPRITADDMASFVRSIKGLGILVDGGILAIQAKFGDAIDRGNIRKLREYDIDDNSLGNLEQIADRLASDHRSLCHIGIALGMPCDELLRQITRDPSSENRVGFYPDSLAIIAGPIKLSNMQTDEPVQVGWLGLDISGSGYLYPWTFQEIVKRLEASTEVKLLTDLCRTKWPVQAIAPSKAIVKHRRRLQELWPYDIQTPLDWAWGLCESG